MANIDKWVQKRARSLKTLRELRKTRPKGAVLSNWIIKRFKEEVTVKQIASDLGMRDFEVSHILSEAGIPMGRGRPVNIDFNSAAERYMSGETAVSIARDLGIGHTTLTKKFQANGIVRPKNSVDALNKKIAHEYRAGASMTALGNRYNMHRTSIRKRLIAVGVKLR